MFQLLKKYRKGVSPVIAIVLLIALTVAAAAVIWTLTSGILDDASGHTLVVSGSASATNSSDGSQLMVTATLRANSLTTFSQDITRTTISSAPGAVPTVTAVSTDPTSMASGDTRVTITFTAAAGSFDSGSYTVSLSWSGEGDDPKLIPITGIVS